MQLTPVSKFSLMLLLSFNSFFILQAQTGVIEGYVFEKSSNEPVPYASIVLLNADSYQITDGSVTNNEGFFQLNRIPFGMYDMVVSFIGFSPDTIKKLLVSGNHPEPEPLRVYLSASVISLDEVEVVSHTKTVVNSIDKKTYSPGDFEIVQDGTASDLLSRLPSVAVTPDGEISLRGTTDFVVYLNGKPTQMEPSMLLGQIAVSSIESIEVITIPTAKYDAQGKGGIVNIKTKKNSRHGFAFSANAHAGGAPWGETTDNYSGFEMNDNRYGGGINMQYGLKNTGFYGLVNYNRKNINGQRTGDARILDTVSNFYKHMVAAGERPEWFENYSASAGFDHHFINGASVSGSYFYGDRTEGRSAFYIYNIFFADELKNSPQDEQWIYNPNTDDRYGIFHTANLDFQTPVNDNDQLNISLLYEHSDLSRKLNNFDYEYFKGSDETGDLANHYEQTDHTPLDGYRLSIDYHKELMNGNKISYGIQPQYVQIAGSFSYDTLGIATDQWNDYASLENSIDMERGIYAGYIDYSGKIGKFMVVSGLRLEYTNQTMKIENPDYFTIFDRPTRQTYNVKQLDWFPTFHLSYDFNELTRYILAVSRRINRPPVKNMAPFLYRRHLEVYVVGDPSLKPEYVNNIEMSLNRKINKSDISFTGFYRGTENAIFRVNTVYSEELVLIRSYTNSGNSRSTGVEFNTNIHLANAAKLFLGGALYNYHVEGEVFGYKEDNTSTNWNLKSNLNVFISKQLRFTADFSMVSATVTAQGENELFYMTNAALSYSPKVLPAWNFTLKGLDLLRSNIQGLDTRAFNQTGTQIFYQETEYTRYGPIVEMGISYALNKNEKNNQKKGSTFGQEEF